MSMNKKTRSLINTRYEAQKIYYQRKEIKRKEKEIKELNNVKEFYKRRSLDYKSRCEKAIEYIKDNCYDEGQLIDDLWEEIPILLNILKGSEDNDTNS